MHPSALVGLLAFAAAASALPGAASRHAHSQASISNLKDKIKNVVVLVMENRSVDNLLGGQTIKGLENPINNGPFCNPYNVSNPAEGTVCSAAHDYDSVTDDPDHAVYGNNIEFYGTFTPDNEAIASGKLTPSQKGFVHEQLRIYGAKANRTQLSTQVMNYYTEDQVPVLTQLVQNYVVFNHWHSDIPGPTDPNRAALTSGTSYGHGSNDNAFNEHAFPQRSIFQQLSEMDHSWINYYDTAGGTGPDAEFYDWTYTADRTSQVQPLEQFYTDAAAGNLTEFTYLNPSCCGVGTNSMHPSGLISDGEKLIKKVYEALRNGPQWSDTLFILSFDETGGFHDHVPPPLAPAPDSLAYTATTPSGEKYTFPFNRLGGRIPTLLISPWVGKGYVEQKGTDIEGETVSYSASSILRTLGYLWDFEPFTPRVEYAASFDHLIQTRARNDTPATLPEPVAFRK
ncbi:phosphoesterase superfamily protein [Aspergillus homomorphus CBS 101889]|uniref:Phosphoesterase n=1 Tax=Aspergillus homomorphus (strain CBS 101889) TaxID=1450537 RepID=A0A395HVE0_ASPHC|nr:phosphoesterase [Aspergillus homomorphus CBS 101889]RAL11777.1 phosphoesterase [Aspergillus homomorphus CBS 101889]